MDDCCGAKEEELGTLHAKHKNVLVSVLIINAVLFVLEAAAGLLAHSTALLADSLDMLGDSLVYGFSLYVLWRSAKWRVLAAIVKGILMAVFGFGVLVQAAYKILAGAMPSAETMGVIGLLVLVGNAVCFFLLYRHRSDDLNMRSTWLCSRNDIIANVSVLAAAAGVAVTGSPWPDLVVGGAIALLFIRTAWTVLSESMGEYRTPRLGLISHH
jgi:cation diffusion facilitator family transporter